MKILVIDTETNGLPPKGSKIEDANVNEWPYILQLSYILFDTDKNKILTLVDDIVKVPDNVDIHYKSTEIHGITKEKSKKGKNIIELLKILNNNIEKCDIIVGHNIKFDINMILIECLRNNFLVKIDIDKKRYECTMNMGRSKCQLYYEKNGKYILKSPKLSELHFSLFESIPKGCHNSLNDIIITLRCYYNLKYNQDLIKNSIVFKKIFNFNCV